jgi:hypothetical protein
MTEPKHSFTMPETTIGDILGLWRDVKFLSIADFTAISEQKIDTADKEQIEAMGKLHNVRGENLNDLIDKLSFHITNHLNGAIENYVSEKSLQKICKEIMTTMDEESRKEISAIFGVIKDKEKTVTKKTKLQGVRVGVQSPYSRPTTGSNRGFVKDSNLR